MSDRKPICRLSVRKDKQTFNILTVWPGKFPGLYDINRDKPNGNYQTMSFGDALRAWSAGDAYLQLSWESQREKRSGGQSRQEEQDDGDPF